MIWYLRFTYLCCRSAGRQPPSAPFAKQAALPIAVPFNGAANIIRLQTNLRMDEKNAVRRPAVSDQALDIHFSLIKSQRRPRTLTQSIDSLDG